MSSLFSNVLTASFHGSVLILAVLVIRLVLWKTPKKYICLLWLLAGIRLLLPIEIRSDLSLQPRFRTFGISRLSRQEWVLCSISRRRRLSRCFISRSI